MTPRVIMQTFVTVCALLVAGASATITPCPRPCECFAADNGIRAANCTDLPDQMTTAWPQKTLRIRFEGRRASPVVLKNKAFKHFPGLTYLDVAGGAIQYVGNAAFIGLPELLELNLVGTGVRKLHRDTFAGNRKLAFLSLRKNPGLFVGPSFLASESVTELDLSECALKSLKSVYFRSLPNLKYLFAAKNELKVLGSQFGPAGLKYVDLGHNRIEHVYEDLEAYKRLRTVDLTGNPVMCTCELSEVDKRLAARGVAFGNTVKCENTGRPLGDMAEACSDEDAMGDGPADMYQADNLLKIDQKSMQSSEDAREYFGSGEGSGDGELLVTSDRKPSTPASAAAAAADKIGVPEDNGTRVDRGQTTDATTTALPGSSGAAETETVPTEPPANASETVPAEPPANASETVPTEPPANASETVPTEPPANASESVPMEPAIAVAKAPVLQSPPTTPSSDGNSTGVIVSKKIQAPEDERDDVPARVTDYFVSNVGVTGTAALLAAVLVAIVYKAACARRSRSHDIGADVKEVELREIKYVAANAEEDGGGSPATGGSAAEDDRLLRDEDRDSDDEDGADEPPASPAVRDPAQNGPLRDGGVVHRNAAGRQPETASPPPPPSSSGGSPDVPTRVIVKLTETPKASKPITINNVH